MNDSWYWVWTLTYSFPKKVTIWNQWQLAIVTLQIKGDHGSIEGLINMPPSPQYCTSAA